MDLLEASEHYAALDSSDDATWHPYSVAAREGISNLQLLGGKQVRPVILSAIKKVSVHEFERLIRLLEIIIVRWQLIGEERTGALEIQCAKLAEQIWTEKVKTGSEAFTSISSLYQGDEIFQQKFAKKEGLTNQKAIYLLRKLEQQERDAQRGSAGRELTPGSNLSLEHILPKSPGEEWVEVLDVDPRLLDDCVLRLGNMCLLTEGRNREAARAGFERKKQLYANSDLLTTRTVGDYANWDRTAIDRHQAWLAARATAVWRFQ
jgi:hypothetical protein